MMKTTAPSAVLAATVPVRTARISIISTEVAGTSVSIVVQLAQVLAQIAHTESTRSKLTTWLFIRHVNL